MFRSRGSNFFCYRNNWTISTYNRNPLTPVTKYTHRKCPVNQLFGRGFAHWLADHTDTVYNLQPNWIALVTCSIDKCGMILRFSAAELLRCWLSVLCSVVSLRPACYCFVSFISSTLIHRCFISNNCCLVVCFDTTEILASSLLQYITLRPCAFSRLSPPHHQTV